METATQRTATQAMGAIPRYAAGGPIRLKKPAKPGAASVMAAGGAIKGKGTGTSDEVPIMASNGEFVIRAAAVEEIGLPALRAINALGGNIPKSPNRNDNKYFEGDIVKDRETLVAQIPTGGAGAGPTPVAAPSAPATVPVMDRIFSPQSQWNPTTPDQRAATETSRINTLASQEQARFNARQFAADNPGQTMPTPAAPPTPQAAMATAPAYRPAVDSQAANPQPRPDAPNPASGSPDEAMPDGKVNVTRQANGVMSFSGQNITGQPQYTGSAANTMNSGVITAQNQGAMDGIQARQDARDQGARNKMQYDAEVAGAQATNEAGRRMNLEYDLKNGNRNERLAAQAILGSMDATAKDVRGNALTTRGQDITSRGQDLNAAATSQNQKLAQSKDGREAASSAMDQKAKQQLMDAQQEYLNAGDDPVKQKAAERKLITLGGKQPNDKGQVITLPDTLGDQGQVIRGGQAVLMPDGTLVRPEQAKAQTQYETGKVYTDAKGNRAKWDGKAFVPA